MLKDILINLFVATPLSIYSGIIVSRYYLFLTALNEARRIVLTLEQVWEYRFLERVVSDPQIPTGQRTVFMSKCVASNEVDWQLTLVGLQLKEQGHWETASAIDTISQEVSALRDEFLSRAKLKIAGEETSVTEYVADWHRTLSKQKPSLWRILQPWPNKRYRHMSCVSVDESTGDWHEVEPSRSGQNSTER